MVTHSSILAWRIPWTEGIRSNQISRSVVSDSLRPHESQHASQGRAGHWVVRGASPAGGVGSGLGWAGGSGFYGTREEPTVPTMTHNTPAIRVLDPAHSLGPEPFSLTELLPNFPT